jgi:hypothetical protein
VRRTETRSQEASIWLPGEQRAFRPAALSAVPEAFHQFSNCLESAPPAKAPCESPFTMSSFLFATEATGDRQAWGMAQVSKKGQPEGLDARAEQVLSWLAVLGQTRPAFGAVCLADRSLKNKIIASESV